MMLQVCFFWKLRLCGSQELLANLYDNSSTNTNTNTNTDTDTDTDTDTTINTNTNTKIEMMEASLANVA